jgi:hypothetical protein
MLNFLNELFGIVLIYHQYENVVSKQDENVISKMKM